MGDIRRLVKEETYTVIVHAMSRGLQFAKVSMVSREEDQDLFFLTWLEWEELLAWVEREGKPSLTSTEPPRLLERRRRQKGG